MSKERQDLYVKYRVFREPEDVEEHPCLVWATYTSNLDSVHMSAGRLKEVEEFVFVLKPDSDPHAVIALAAYAMAIRDEKPQLSSDLRGIVEEYR